MLLFHAKTKFRIDQATKLLAIKALYNIDNVPGVYYCDKYEIIVYTQYVIKKLYIQYTVFSIKLIYSNCTARNERVFVFDFYTIRLITESYTST